MPAELQECAHMAYAKNGTVEEMARLVSCCAAAASYYHQYPSTKQNKHKNQPESSSTSQRGLIWRFRIMTFRVFQVEGTRKTHDPRCTCNRRMRYVAADAFSMGCQKKTACTSSTHAPPRRHSPFRVNMMPTVLSCCTLCGCCLA